MEITSKANERIKHLKKLLTDKDYRYEHKQFVVEGLRALDGIKDVQELYLREGTKEPGIKCRKTYIVGENIFKTLASTENSQGVIAVAGLTILRSADISKVLSYILLDRLQDPGNMGAIIRTACAFGFKGVVVMPGCVDPFSPKAARAAASALWKIDIIRAENIDELAAFNIIAADKSGKDAGRFVWPEGFLLAIGNEASGLSKELESRACHTVKIPIRGEMESLNASVSAGILMYIASGKRER